jgi:zeta-carotene desaturase
VAVIGGGLAGLAAGTALSAAGFRVTLLERRPYLGGRASSYELPGTGEVVDNCQHVLLGCCTNLIDFYRRIGAENLVRWYGRLTFLEPGGRRSEIGSSWLPAPLHALPSFLVAKALPWRDKRAIAHALRALLRRVPEDDGRPFSQWLAAHGQTPGAIERFWKVVLVSALNEDLERVSTPVAAMVFRESFLKSAAGGRMGVPRAPLTALYSKAGDYIRAHQGTVELRAVAEELQPVEECAPAAEGGEPPAAAAGGKAAGGGPEGSGVFASRSGVRLCVNGAPRVFDYAVVAVPFDAVARLLPAAAAPAAGLQAALRRFETSPITGIHLWFDRQVTELDHAVLLDRTIQWMFQKSRILDRRAGSESGSYLEVVVSACRSLVQKPRQEIIDLALRELADFFPAVKNAKLVKATVVKEVHATFSPLPGSDAYRPNAATPWPRVFLAGDWTATGWPATMEGAVRSGYIAAEALCRAARREERFLVPDLKATGFMTFLV